MCQRNRTLLNSDLSTDRISNYSSSQAKEFIQSLLVQSPVSRPTAKIALKHKWLAAKNVHSPRSNKPSDYVLMTACLNTYIERRKHQVLDKSIFKSSLQESSP